MAKQTSTTVREVDAMSAAELLDFARRQRREAEAADARLLVAAAQWADMHPPGSLGGEAAFVHGEHVEPIAGPGCPEVAEFCIAELGAVLGMSTAAAKRLVGHALEIRHRLPRLWGEVQAGRVPAWRARIIAEATIHASPALTAATMGWIDSQAAPFAARMSTGQAERLVAEAIRRQDPPPPPDPDDPPMPEQRHVNIDREQVQFDGTVLVNARLDLVDSIDLDTVLTQHAQTQADLGSTASLDARRAMALGDLARTQLALDLTIQAAQDTQGTPARALGSAGPTGGSGPARPTRGVTHPSRSGSVPSGNPEAFTRTAREVVLHVHFNSTLTGTGTKSLEVAWLGRMEHGQRHVLLDQVKAWCGQSHTRVTIRPVIDLNTEISTGAYTPTERLAEQVRLRDRTCVFPWCTRPARRCDLDHVEPFDPTAAAEGRPQPGPTASWNLGCLCRKHHRLKTHGRWKVKALRSGVFEWTSPHGHRFLRDHTGTRPLDHGHNPTGPPPRP